MGFPAYCYDGAREWPLMKGSRFNGGVASFFQEKRTTGIFGLKTEIEISRFVRFPFQVSVFIKFCSHLNPRKRQKKRSTDVSIPRDYEGPERGPMAIPRRMAFCAGVVGGRESSADYRRPPLIERPMQIAPRGRRRSRRPCVVVSPAPASESIRASFQTE